MSLTEERPRYGLAALTFSDALLSAVGELVKVIALHDAHEAHKTIVDANDIEQALPKALGEIQRNLPAMGQLPEAALLEKIAALIQRYSPPPAP